MEEVCKIFFGSQLCFGHPKTGFLSCRFQRHSAKSEIEYVKIDRKCKHKKIKRTAKAEDQKRLSKEAMP